MTIGLGLAILPIIIWLGLLVVWGQFWRTDQQLPTQSPDLQRWPTVCAVIPARNEADVLPTSLRSLLTQDYPGSFTLILVDDQSTDGTADIAQHTAMNLGKSQQLNILSGQPLPPGWTGKLWAMEQGTQATSQLNPDYILLTDADIHGETPVRECLGNVTHSRICIFLPKAISLSVGQ
jgi:cellulose synthase/poly-beta-1,6-N-acetylglucosamine synthase-like glycosyltransferase